MTQLIISIVAGLVTGYVAYLNRKCMKIMLAVQHAQTKTDDAVRTSLLKVDSAATVQAEWQERLKTDMGNIRVQLNNQTVFLQGQLNGINAIRQKMGQSDADLGITPTPPRPNTP